MLPNGSLNCLLFLESLGLNLVARVSLAPSSDLSEIITSNAGITQQIGQDLWRESHFLLLFQFSSICILLLYFDVIGFYFSSGV